MGSKLLSRTRVTSATQGRTEKCKLLIHAFRTCDMNTEAMGKVMGITENGARKYRADLVAAGIIYSLGKDNIMIPAVYSMAKDEVLIEHFISRISSTPRDRAAKKPYVEPVQELFKVHRDPLVMALFGSGPAR